MPPVKRTRLMEMLWKVHRVVFEASKGRVGRRMMGWPVLLLTTTGRKSGRPRPATLYYLEDDDRYVVVASNAGEPTHPGWYLNLEARPDVTLTVDGRTFPATASVATGSERDRLWDMIVARDRSYQVYQNRTRRPIPIVILKPSGRPS